MARLDQAQGLVERESATSAGAFHTVGPGAEFALGDAVRTGAAASAGFRLSDGGRVALREKTLLRFSATPGTRKECGLEVETGLAELEASSGELQLHTSVGEAVLESGTRVQIAAHGASMSFLVLIGAAHFQTREGLRDVAANQRLDVAIGGAVLEPTLALTDPRSQAALAGEGAPPKTLSLLIRGPRARARASTAEGWKLLAIGEAQLQPGSSLELDTGTSAELSDGSAQLSLDGGGAFRVAADDSALVQTERGHVGIRSGANPVVLRVPGGKLVILAESRATLDVGRDGAARLSVASGKAEVQTVSEKQTVVPGERAELSGAGQLHVEGRSLDYADLMVLAGSSFVVHDPSPPTAIRFALQSVCATGALVERLGAGHGAPLVGARGDTGAALLFPAGQRRYRVRCLEAQGISEKVAANGVVTVLRDSGNTALSRVAPMSRIDMDGRSYTVVYQNLLPKIVVRWLDAPPASRYTLSVESAGGQRSLQLTQAAYTFAAGQLAEGSHLLKFSVGQVSSPPTKLAIVFENVSPTARILAPRDRGFTWGSPITVAGIAAAGWTVRVGDRKLALDDQARFSEQLTESSEDRALAIRFDHPLRGIHYYLRRSTGAAP